MKRNSTDNKGFTLIELMVVISIFVLLIGSGSLVFGDMIARNSLRYYGYRIVQDLREMRSNAVAQKQDDSWGVYFNPAAQPNSYILFKGSNFASRDSAFDIEQILPKVLHLSRVNLNSFKEVTFSSSKGMPNHPGYLILNSDKGEYTISINSFGLVEYQ
jgi:prepilin-type N-terminal cleavage/methylation domain-containing protein